MFIHTLETGHNKHTTRIKICLQPLNVDIQNTGFGMRRICENTNLIACV